MISLNLLIVFRLILLFHALGVLLGNRIYWAFRFLLPNCFTIDILILLFIRLVKLLPVILLLIWSCNTTLLFIISDIFCSFKSGVRRSAFRLVIDSLTKIVNSPSFSFSYLVALFQILVEIFYPFDGSFQVVHHLYLRNLSSSMFFTRLLLKKTWGTIILLRIWKCSHFIFFI